MRPLPGARREAELAREDARHVALVGEAAGGSGLGEGMLIQIERFEPVGFEAVIDEPVTGSGNDDFLAPEGGAGDDRCTEEDRTKCDKPPEGTGN